MRILSLLFWLSFSVLHAQSPLQYVAHYTERDGLCNPEVYCIREDVHGFLWLATAEGLCRFDGYQFKSFFHSKYEPNSLPHNTVTDLLEYQPGMLLIASANGLGVYNTWSNAFENERITHQALAAGSGAYVTKLCRDHEGNIWVNYDGEFDILDTTMQFQFRLTEQPWAQPLKGTRMFFEDWTIDDKGLIWMPTDNKGIQVIDVKNKTVINQQNNPDHWPFFENQIIRALFIVREKQALYVAPWGGGILQYGLQEHVMQNQFGIQQPTEANSINSIVQLKDKRIFGISNGQLFEIHPEPLSMAPVVSSTTIPSISMPVNPIALLQTKSGVVWIGAINGLYQLETKVSPLEISWNNTSEGIDMVLLQNGDSYTVFENGKLIRVNSKLSSARIFSLPYANRSIVINQVAVVHGNEIWISTAKGIYIFNTAMEKFVKGPSWLNALAPLVVNTIFEDRDQNIWISTREPFQLFVFHQDQDKLEKITDPIPNQLSQYGNFARISAIAQDHEANLWFRSVTGGGLLQFNTSSRRWKLFPPATMNHQSIFQKGLLDVFADDQGILWLTTITGDGLLRLDWRKDSVVQFNREDGLLSDHISQILGYKNDLWLISERGYTLFDKVTKKCIVHPWEQSIEPVDIALDTGTMELVVATRSKLIRIPAKEKMALNNRPEVMVDGIFINNQIRFMDPRTEVFKLKPNERNVTIDFTAPSFSKSDHMQFAYFLSGADEDWQIARNSRRAQYATLAPGHYVFKLKLADKAGVWSEPINAFSFVIVPPFWKTPLFFGSLFIALSVVTFLILKSRLKSIRHEAQLKQKMAETEMMALRAQMNPHFIFNSLNSIDALIHSDDKYEATVYLNKFARLIRNILDSAKNNTVPLSKDLETLRLYIELEKLRTENKFATSLDIDPEVLKEDIRVPPLIIQPYVENAILHGLRLREDGLGKLQISLRRQNGHLLYTIEDNGVGRKSSARKPTDGKTSYGMQMSSDRIQLFNKETTSSVVIHDLESNGQATGTKVEVILKLN